MPRSSLAVVQPQSAPSAFPIEKGVPLPRVGSSRTKYPFFDMEVGDNFFVAGADERARNSILGAADGFAKRNAPDRKFTTRKVDGGVRVWRIA